MASLRDFIVQNKKRLLIVLVILLLIPLSIFVTTWYIDSSRVTVVNEDPRYTVTYKPTPEFTQTLKDMGLWDKGAIYVTEDKSETVKKLEIVFTETPQLGLRQLNEEDLVWSSGTRFESGRLKVFVNLSTFLLDDPFFINNNNRNLDKQISLIVLKSVNNSVGNLDGFKLSDLPDETIEKFVENTSYTPFFIENEI